MNIWELENHRIPYSQQIAGFICVENSQRSLRSHSQLESMRVGPRWVWATILSVFSGTHYYTYHVQISSHFSWLLMNDSKLVLKLECNCSHLQSRAGASMGFDNTTMKYIFPCRLFLDSCIIEPLWTSLDKRVHIRSSLRNPCRYWCIFCWKRYIILHWRLFRVCINHLGLK